jgi:hypothetical protein
MVLSESQLNTCIPPAVLAGVLIGMLVYTSLCMLCLDASAHQVALVLAIHIKHVVNFKARVCRQHKLWGAWV